MMSSILRNSQENVPPTWCFKMAVVKGKSFFCCIQSDLHLISSPLMYSDGAITWCHFSLRYQLSLFILFSSYFIKLGDDSTNFKMHSPLLNKTRFCLRKFNVNEQQVHWFFTKFYTSSLLNIYNATELK